MLTSTLIRHSVQCGQSHRNHVMRIPINIHSHSHSIKTQLHSQTTILTHTHTLSANMQRVLVVQLCGECVVESGRGEYVVEGVSRRENGYAVDGVERVDMQWTAWREWICSGRRGESGYAVDGAAKLIFGAGRGEVDMCSRARSAGNMVDGDRGLSTLGNVSRSVPIDVQSK